MSRSDLFCGYWAGFPELSSPSGDSPNSHPLSSPGQHQGFFVPKQRGTAAIANSDAKSIPPHRKTRLFPRLPQTGVHHFQPRETVAGYHRETD